LVAVDLQSPRRPPRCITAPRPVTDRQSGLGWAFFQMFGNGNVLALHDMTFR
jgi:hypothetical protein